MKEYGPYFNHQMARFGTLTIQQLLTLGRGRFKRSTLYYHVSGLIREGRLHRISHKMDPLIGYSATRGLYSAVYGKDHERHTGPRAKELNHSIAVANAMIELSRYSAVTGLATENEWAPDDIQDFCHERTPDGIIQISQGDLSYELAVEVELSNKGERETGRVLGQYRQTFQKNLPCVGVLIIAKEQAVFSMYQEKMKELPSDVEERILLTTPEGLETLNPRYYGTRAEYPGPALELIRNSSKGTGVYFPKNYAKCVPEKLP
jgi:hypothetical protein